MISENTVYKYMDDVGERIRIIYIDEPKDEFAFVSLDIEFCMPKWEKLSKIKEEIDNNVLVKISDPYLKSIDENSISQLEREKRDSYWKIVSDVYENRLLEILKSKTRAKVIQDISEISGMADITLKRIFSKFWKRGMSKNALLPDYKKLGGKGKEKKLSDKKIGKPRRVDANGDVVIGINVTEDIKRQFELAIEKCYRDSNKISLVETYNYVLTHFFSDPIIKNGEKDFIVWDKDRIPTYDQFYYWFKKFKDPKKDIIFRDGIKEFELNNRELLSNSTIETNGPGTRFQVDATVADVYLVSSLDRNRIIGRPVVYAIIDVFSRLVTGIYAGLEGPSWMGAMMALDNMISDKVEFCKSYGININEEQWPAHHLPDILIADRGEFEGYSVENLINNLNIKVENTPPYRGDLKGIVERYFRTLNIKLKHMTPGAIQKEFRKRGDADYRLDATLTLEEFMKIFINLVIHHNKKIINEYPIEKEMLIDNVVATPLQLWNWGIENKKGRLRIVDREILRLNILPKGKASVSRAGIKFKGLYYGSKKALEEQWFIKSKVRSKEIVYDPRNMNNIYILHKDGRAFESCYLLEKSKQYKDCILEEIILNFELISELKEMQKSNQNQLNVDIDNEIRKIVKKAQIAKSKELDYGMSKSKRVKGIKDNRAVEKEFNREKESFRIEEEAKSSDKISEVISLPKINEKLEKKSNIGNSRIMEMIKKKRDERREK
ncbi:transposase [Clostridium sp. P21]|uniref:Transposase n=1 Tax=Clostridium muellerianum TaxID=2716538 RepID=A0A7Y0HN19_9CLOT|nr:Mu transposase C-terminal domain-containing protein [Clostridium muellerianum]NMM62207.1 transposase [Clostridium muellerianum]